MIIEQGLWQMSFSKGKRGGWGFPCRTHLASVGDIMQLECVIVGEHGCRCSVRQILAYLSRAGADPASPRRGLWPLYYLTPSADSYTGIALCTSFSLSLSLSHSLSLASSLSISPESVFLTVSTYLFVITML